MMMIVLMNEMTTMTTREACSGWGNDDVFQCRWETKNEKSGPLFLIESGRTKLRGAPSIVERQTANRMPDPRDGWRQTIRIR
jgi:hypothetical protein